MKDNEMKTTAGKPAHRIEISEVIDVGKWSDVMSVGVGAIDADHRRLFGLFNHLRSMENTDKDASKIITKMLADLYEYTDYHFKREETLMEACGYPDLEDHRKKHRMLMEKVMDFADDLPSAPGASQVRNIADFLDDWLVNHIMKEDKDYESRMAGKDEVITNANLDFDRKRLTPILREQDGNPQVRERPQ